MENSERDGNTRPPDLFLEKPICRSGSNSLNWTWNNRLVPDRKKECIKVVYCHPAYLTYMQSTSWEMLGWRKRKLESRLPGEISITSDMQISEGRKWRGTKKSLEESEKVVLKLKVQKTKIMASGPITSWEIDGKTVETMSD